MSHRLPCLNQRRTPATEKRRNKKIAKSKITCYLRLNAIRFVNSVCTYDLQFMKTRSFSPNLSKLAKADISCQFKKTRYFADTVYKTNGLYLNIFCCEMLRVSNFNSAAPIQSGMGSFAA